MTWVSEVSVTVKMRGILNNLCLNICFFTRQKRVLDLKFQESFVEIQISSESDLFLKVPVFNFNLSILGFN